MRPETVEFNRTLIASALANIEAWEKWAMSIPEDVVRNLNLSLIRLTKGLVKAWRLFLVDCQRETNTECSPLRPPSDYRDKEKPKWPNTGFGSKGTSV